MTTVSKSRKNSKPRKMQYQVNHERTSGGPKFSSLTEAVAYIAHCMKPGNGNDGMAIQRIA